MPGSVMHRLVGSLDPRPFAHCATCGDGGMVETSYGAEDACPTCEGGVWRERVTWRAWLSRLRLPFGLRVRGWSRIPTLYRDWEA